MIEALFGSALRSALGSLKTLVNVGAGAGSYEPDDATVVAVEPSWHMCSQRPAGRAPVIGAKAEHLSFRDASVDAALAVLTVHHWRDRGAGLREMLRGARARAVLFTWDPSHPGFWLVRDDLPEILLADRKLFPSIHELAECPRAGTAVGSGSKGCDRRVGSHGNNLPSFAMLLPLAALLVLGTRSRRRRRGQSGQYLMM